MKTLLWLDDIRNPFLNKEGRVPKGEYKIEWVRNFEEFADWIEMYGTPDVISFDHDLADEHYTPEEYWSDYNESKEYQESQNYIEKTGVDCAKFLVEYCMDEDKELPVYFVHSANPPGADNIRAFLNSFKNFKNNNIK